MVLQKKAPLRVAVAVAKAKVVIVAVAVVVEGLTTVLPPTQNSKLQLTKTKKTRARP